jgi:hypothetical protein
MTPPLLANEHRNIALTQSVLPGQGVLTYAGVIQRANFSDGLCRQLCSARTLAMRHPALAYRVSHVLCMRAKKEMARANAARVVTARTIVADLHSRWDWSIRQLPRHSRGNNADVARKNENTSPARARISNPNPTSINLFGLLNLLPESFGNGHSGIVSGGSLWMRHSLTSYTGRGIRHGRGVCSAAGLSLCPNYTAKAGCS